MSTTNRFPSFILVPIVPELSTALKKKVPTLLSSSGVIIIYPFHTEPEPASEIILLSAGAVLKLYSSKGILSSASLVWTVTTIVPSFTGSGSESTISAPGARSILNLMTADSFMV